VGIILCAAKDATIVRYSVLDGNEKLFATRYKLVLPSEEELRLELIREQRLLEEQEGVNERFFPPSLPRCAVPNIFRVSLSSANPRM
jgi:hypothetical protein